MKRIAIFGAGTLLLCACAQAEEIRPLPPGARGPFAAAAASPQPRAVLQQPVEAIIPELILGGEWTSVIKLTNRSSKAIPTTNVFFVDNQGNPMKTAFQTSFGNVVTDVGFSFSLGSGGTIEVTFFGGTTSAFGHAIIDLCNGGTCLTGVYAEVTLRNRNSTRPDFESVFPAEQPTDLQYMFWDHRNGNSTVLYLVNENLSPSTVTLDYRNTANQVIRTLTVTLPSLGSQILTPHVLAPETIGLHGTLVIRGVNSGGMALITATALRINPTNSFTPMRAFVPHL